ncbi:MAG: hypothetical protein ACI837_000300 [Crocinitomicaceae bacterium]|jgi:hypothetical protein
MRILITLGAIALYSFSFSQTKLPDAFFGIWVTSSEKCNIAYEDCDNEGEPIIIRYDQHGLLKITGPQWSTEIHKVTKLGDNSFKINYDEQHCEMGPSPNISMTVKYAAPNKMDFDFGSGKETYLKCEHEETKTVGVFWGSAFSPGYSTTLLLLEDKFGKECDIPLYDKTNNFSEYPFLDAEYKINDKLFGQQFEITWTTRPYRRYSEMIGENLEGDERWVLSMKLIEPEIDNSAKHAEMKKFLFSSENTYGWKTEENEIELDFLNNRLLFIQGPDGESTMWEGKWWLKGDRLFMDRPDIEEDGGDNCLSVKVRREDESLFLDDVKYTRSGL